MSDNLSAKYTRPARAGNKSGNPAIRQWRRGDVVERHSASLFHAACKMCETSQTCSGGAPTSSASGCEITVEDNVINDPTSTIYFVICRCC